MNPYLIMAVIVAAAVGWGTWQKQIASNAKLEVKAVRASLSMAEKELEDAAAINRGALKAAEIAAADAAAQAKIAADTRAKERLAWIRLEKLKKEIGNVPTSENVPVSSHIEHVLDELRSPVAGDGSRADSPNENGTAGEGGADRPNVPAETSATAEAPGT